MELRDIVADLIDRVGYSQEALAAASGVRQATISRIYTGASKGTWETGKALVAIHAKHAKRSRKARA